MFTGIVTDIGEVTSVEPKADGLRRIVIACNYDRDMIAIGASIACAGVCLTVVETGLTGNRTWFAVDAVRALYAAGDVTTAQRWFAMVQANATPGNADAALAVLKLWPLPFLRDPRYHQSWDGEAILGPWVQGMDALGGPKAEGAKQVELVLTLLVALDFKIPAAVWSPLFQDLLTVSASIPTAGLWIHLRSASLSGDIGATVLFAMLALGEGGPAEAAPIVLSEVISALRRVNLDDTARQIAVEAVMAHAP